MFNAITNDINSIKNAGNLKTIANINKSCFGVRWEFAYSMHMQETDCKLSNKN